MEPEPLQEQLALHQITIVTDIQQLFEALSVQADVACLSVQIDGLEAYTQSWGDRAGVWLILAVVQMVKEIVSDYDEVSVGFMMPATLGIIVPEEHQQEIGHRLVTAYQEIYDVLLRTHYKPSSPVWHRRAVTQTFPQLVLEIKATGTTLDEDEEA